jgi:Fic family protein
MPSKERKPRSRPFSSKHASNRLLDGFEGKLTTAKWAKLVKCSQDTAARDILALVSQGVLKRNAEGVEVRAARSPSNLKRNGAMSYAIGAAIGQE